MRLHWLDIWRERCVGGIDQQRHQQAKRVAGSILGSRVMGVGVGDIPRQRNSEAKRS
jgi:hypothetical protein